MDLPRRLAAEAIGTCLLVATVVGSGVMADRLTDEAAVTLLGNTIPTGAILFVLITIWRRSPGAQFNPAVSLVFAILGALRWRDAAAYSAVQIVGAVVGTILAHLMFELPLLQASSRIRAGGAQWLSAGVATFGLVAVILAGVRFQKTAVPALVGLYIAAAYWFTASTSFANPAVTMARAFTDTFSGIRSMDVPGFIVAQLVGATVAAACITWLLKTKVCR